MKKISMLLIFIIIISFNFALANFDGSVAESFASGTGSQNDPYHINSPEQLALLSQNVNQGNRYYGKYFVLDNDIDLNNVEWTPIGNYKNTFSGFFDGQNHIVNNLKITNTIDYDLENGDCIAYVGLFGRTSSIQNLSVNGEINIIKNDVDYMYIYAGGICGNSYGTIINCHNKCNVYVSCVTNSSNVYVGGIAGQVSSDGLLSTNNCSNEGDVYGCAVNIVRCGGIAGSGFKKVENCNNRGTIIGEFEEYAHCNHAVCVGGILGQGNGTFLNNCYNSGEITGLDRVRWNYWKFRYRKCYKLLEHWKNNCH